MSRVYDLTVIGGGPAGMMAAAFGAELGLSTILLDEQSALGGQVYNNVERSPLREHNALGTDYYRGLELTQRFRASRADYVSRACVWQIESHEARWDTLFSVEGRARRIGSQQIILATGAYERPFPVPGWTLPGVMSAGAAQILLKSSGLATSGAVFAGSGPLLYLIAMQYARSGVPVRAVLDTTPLSHYWRAVPRLPSAMSKSRALAKGLRMQLIIRRAGIPFTSAVTSLEAQGQDRIKAVSYGAKGRTYRLDNVDTLFLHHGVVPNTQLALSANCDQFWDSEQNSWQIKCDPWGRTSKTGLYIAGDAAGILGADAAPLRARLTVLAACQQVGLIGTDQLQEQSRPLLRQLRREQRLHRFLDALYKPAKQFRVPPDETVICRCEEVTAEAVRQCARGGQSDPNRLKSLLRCGMGPCQGRMCSSTIAEIVADEMALDPGQVRQFRVRPPVKPVRVSELASLDIDQEANILA